MISFKKESYGKHLIFFMKLDEADYLLAYELYNSFKIVEGFLKFYFFLKFHKMFQAKTIHLMLTY